MKAKVKTNYQIIEDKSYEASINLDFEAYAKENELEIEDKDDLESYLMDCISESDQLFISPDHINIADEYSEERDILNMEELIEYYSFLIVPSTKTCCDDAPWNATYCPTCGKKLNE